MNEKTKKIIGIIIGILFLASILIILPLSLYDEIYSSLDFGFL